MKTDISDLLQKEMNRRDFLKHVGVGVVALSGAAALVKTLNGVTGTSIKRQKQTSGYGSDVYGGRRALARIKH